METKLSGKDHELARKIMKHETRKGTDRSDERVNRKSIKTNGSSVVDDKLEKWFSQDASTRQSLNFGGRKEKSYRFVKTKDSALVTEKTERNLRKSGSNRNSSTGIKQRNKGAKKGKVDSPETRLRIGLDMCSRKGDVMVAINFYDSARKEGVKIGQYHYAVLLYLCSSAATGFIQPAKSGSSNRNLNGMDLNNEGSKPRSMDFDDFGEIGKMNNGGTESNILSSNGKHGKKETITPSSIAYSKLNHKEDCEIQVNEKVKKYALERGFEIYEHMCLEKVPMNEATLTSMARMAMSMHNGDLAFDMVKQMKPLGIHPRLRSYGPALSVFCNSGDVDKAFCVEKHMLDHGVHPEEPELEVLLKVSIEANRADKVYYLLHKLRTNVRKVSPSTADLIEKWFNSKAASRVGKRKFERNLMITATENGGGGWHGLGFLGKGKWSTIRTKVDENGFCKCCGEKLAMIDLDPVATESFAESVASIAAKREKNSSFQKFQKWLDYYGPFEAVIDAANVGLFSQRRFVPSKVNAVVNGIRQKLPSKKWPLIIVHNRRITGPKMDEPVNKMLTEKWKTADALYGTPTGSNDDWYWLYAAIKFKCLLVTNDEMRDHTFQLLGNDFFPKWKERHQVRFSFSDVGPVFHMPPPCSVVIQESEKGHWHIPIELEHSSEGERTWLCITRARSSITVQEAELSSIPAVGGPSSDTQIDNQAQWRRQNQDNYGHMEKGNFQKKKRPPQVTYSNLRTIVSASVFPDQRTVLSEIENAERVGDCIINFEI